MDFSTGWLVSSFLVSTVGLGLFLYGKKQVCLPQLATGMALMVYPCFVTSTAWILGLAGVLLAGMWLAVRAGA